MRLDLQDSFNTWKTNPLKNKNSGNSEEKRGDIFGRGFKKNQSPLYPRKKKQILPRQRKMGKPEKMKNGGKHCRHYFRTHYRGYSEEPPVISRWHRKTFTNPFKNQEWGGGGRKGFSQKCLLASSNDPDVDENTRHWNAHRVHCLSHQKSVLNAVDGIRYVLAYVLAVSIMYIPVFGGRRAAAASLTCTSELRIAFSGV